MHIHRACVSRIIIFPHRLQHLFPAENGTPIGHKHLQKIKFLGGQLDIFPAEGYAALDQVHFHIVNTDHPVLLLLHIAGNPTQNRLDSCLDLKNIEGLGHIVVCPVFQAEDLVHIIAFGGQHDNRYVAVLPDPLAYRDTVKLGQHNIQQNQVKGRRVKFGQRFFSVHSAVCLVSFLLQGIFQTFQNQRFVINQEDPFAHE